MGGGSDVSDESSHVDIDDAIMLKLMLIVNRKMRNRSSFPKTKNPSRNMIVGGPQARSTEGLTKSEAKMITDKDKRIRKRWTDSQRMLCLKNNSC